VNREWLTAQKNERREGEKISRSIEIRPQFSFLAKQNSLHLHWRLHSLPPKMAPKKGVEGNRMPRQIVLSVPLIEKRILLIRGQKVMLSSDLAELYEVQPKVLIQAVKRNAQRFPEDFMFRLTPAETKAVLHRVLGLRSQNVTLKRGQHVKYAPYAFTEQACRPGGSLFLAARLTGLHLQADRS
jgi:hypothetical protein